MTRIPLLAALLLAGAAALGGCMDAEESNEAGAGHDDNPAGVGEGSDDVDPCDDGSALGGEDGGDVTGDCEEPGTAPSV